MLTKLIHYLVLPCCEATLLIEKREADAISAMEKFRLRMHLGICKWCKAYNRKVGLIEEMLKKPFNNELHSFDEAEISQFKAKMRNQLPE